VVRQPVDRQPVVNENFNFHSNNLLKGVVITQVLVSSLRGDVL
jgi:hypothetical protein